MVVLQNAEYGMLLFTITTVLEDHDRLFIRLQYGIFSSGHEVVFLEK